MFFLGFCSMYGVFFTVVVLFDLFVCSFWSLVCLLADFSDVW